MINFRLKYFISLALIIITLCNLITINTTNSNQVCVDPQGKEVDWYLILLFPRSSEKSKILSYGYYDNFSDSLKYYEFDKQNFPPLDFTYLSYLGDSTNYIFWNDDKSTEGKINKSSDAKGHSKGSLIYNKTSGRLLTHSLPRFPFRTDNNEIINDLPENAGIYAQHFLCISLNTKEAIKLINHLIIINPSLVYTHGVKDNVGIDSELVEKLLSGETDRSREIVGSITIKSRKGKDFDVYSKSNKSPDLPYDGIIPNTYQSSIFVETWSKPEILEIICDTKYKVMNVLNVKFGDYIYKRENEHSKWAVLEKKPIACYSDLNRISSQKRRGGLTICIEESNLADIMRGSITEHEDCKNEINSSNLLFLQ